MSLRSMRQFDYGRILIRQESKMETTKVKRRAIEYVEKWSSHRKNTVTRHKELQAFMAGWIELDHKVNDCASEILESLDKSYERLSEFERGQADGIRWLMDKLKQADA